MNNSTAEVDAVIAIVKRVRPLLAGQGPAIQGAALADLLALWLAGHQVAGNPAATHRQRAELLKMHTEEVRKLTKVNAKILGTPP